MTALDQATFERAVEIDAHRRLTQHEAAHAAAALLQDLPVDSAEAPFLTLADTEDGDPLAPAGQVRIRRRDDDDGRRKMAIAVLCGPIENSRSGWPPTWPLSDEPTPGDEHDLVELVKALGLDRAGYAAVVQDALELATSRPFERLTLAISYALEQHHTLDEHTLTRIKAITEGAEVEHLTLKARTTVSTDQGVFSAVISTESVDREKDIVSASGMVAALSKWNRPIPLAWNHRSDAADIFGHINSETVHEVNGEVVASGQVHLNSSVGAEAWRSFKSRAIGFSFGYLVPDGGATPRPGGGRHITTLDVFEITATPTPMNNDTRVLNTKALDLDLDRIRTKWRDEMTAVLAADGGTKTVETLRQKADRVARDHAPIQVAEFPC